MSLTVLGCASQTSQRDSIKNLTPRTHPGNIVRHREGHQIQDQKGQNESNIVTRGITGIGISKNYQSLMSNTKLLS